MTFRLLIAGAALMGASTAVLAAPFPLPASAPVNNLTENTAPFLLSDGLTQKLITNRVTLTAQGLPATFGLWDMSAFSKDGKYIYVPSEVARGAGAFRYHLRTGTFKTLLLGDNTGIRTADPNLFNPTVGDYGRFDPATITPHGSLLLGEENQGGRLFEIRNPNTNGTPRVRWLSRIPAVAHEGLRFDRRGNLYFIDEDNSGSIYKYVPSDDDSLRRGQTFVLKVTAFTGAAGEVWNSATNTGKIRTGAALWVPITNKYGVKLTTADPFAFVTTTGGRAAADEIGGTPYGRPEDLTFKTLANRNEAFFLNATSEHAMYSIELTGKNTATVRVFANRSTTDLATGQPVGSAFASPDNAATGADGSIYALEDLEPNGGDIWKFIDANNDGVAESMGRWASLGVTGSEPSGMEQDPKDPGRFIITVQHPASGNDAVWEIRLPGTSPRHDDRDEDRHDDDDRGRDRDND
jgi:Bacterial protein of unknown function (DUF839)